MAPVCWGLWESGTGAAGSPCASRALNPPHSGVGKAGGIEFFTVVTMAVGTCCCCSFLRVIKYSVSAPLLFDTLFFLPLCLDWKTCCFSQNTAKTSDCDRPFQTLDHHEEQSLLRCKVQFYYARQSKSSSLKWQHTVGLFIGLGMYINIEILYEARYRLRFQIS